MQQAARASLFLKNRARMQAACCFYAAGEQARAGDCRRNRLTQSHRRPFIIFGLGGTERPYSGQFGRICKTDGTERLYFRKIRCFCSRLSRIKHPGSVRFQKPPISAKKRRSVPLPPPTKFQAPLPKIQFSRAAGMNSRYAGVWRFGMPANGAGRKGLERKAACRWIGPSFLVHDGCLKLLTRILVSNIINIKKNERAFIAKLVY